MLIENNTLIERNNSLDIVRASDCLEPFLSPTVVVPVCASSPPTVVVPVCVSTPMVVPPVITALNTLKQME